MALPGAVESGWKDEAEIKAAANWPTPTATEYGSNQGGAAGRTGSIRPSLSRLVQGKDNSTGRHPERLNPTWVLQLMGFPVNWLSVPAAMRSFPPSRMSSRELFRDSIERSRRNRFSK